MGDENEMLRMESILDNELGFYWWKRYIAAAFWNNISMPLNLVLTLITALTTAQTTTDNLLSHTVHARLSIVALVVSVLNTFFRPHAQMTENMKIMEQLEKYGDTFETIYYSERTTPEDIRRRTEAYKTLRTEVNKYYTSVSINSRNFFTDMLHLFAHVTVLKGKEGWLYPIDRKSLAQGHMP